jgi:hypothetical protein
MTTLADFWDDDEAPYEPTPQDLAEYAEWSASLHDRDEPFCPADFGDYCPDCDREMADALLRESAAMSDEWYRQLCINSENGANGSNPGWRLDR